eukprot:comp51409_c0_seq1/m.47660 comp51409_c0_seq1/g.47660  ORF comp51409_c0_seq1/g.47660 comp51409_c0_seq1/m.47660 type:complete len:251 (-) comp51409_c0_seq1:235-987(-)
MFSPTRCALKGNRTLQHILLRTPRRHLCVSKMAKVEIERKLLVDEPTEARIASTATSTKIKDFVDDYYDIPGEFSLTRKDWWLRQRSSAWQLKIPSSESYTLGNLDLYLEVEEEEDIRQRLQVGPEIPLEQAVLNAGYRKFTSIRTFRKSYIQPVSLVGVPLLVDCDTVTYLDRPDEPYRLAEVEVMIDQGEDPARGNRAIEQYIETIGVDLNQMGKVEGKVLRYLRLYAPEHHQALLQSGLLTKKGFAS